MRITAVNVEKKGLFVLKKPDKNKISFQQLFRGTKMKKSLNVPKLS